MIKVVDFLARPFRSGPTVLVVTGEEDFLREQAVRHILQTRPVDEELHRMSGVVGASGGLELRDLLDELRTRSLFGGDRLIYLSEADGFVKEHDTALARFLEEGQAVHTLILEGARLMGKGRRTVPTRGLLHTVEQMGGEVISCDPLFDAPFQGKGPAWQSPLSRWVVGQAQSLGKRMSLEDAYVLHRLVGNRLRELDGEIRKLATFVGAKKVITTADVEQCVGEGRLAPVFEVSDAIAGAQFADALQRMEGLFERGIQDAAGRVTRDASGVAAIVIAATASRLRKVGKVRESMAQGSSFDEAAAEVRETPFGKPRLRSQVEAWRSGQGLVPTIRGLLEVERGLKSGGGHPRVLLDQFLVERMDRPKLSAPLGVRRRTWGRP